MVVGLLDASFGTLAHVATGMEIQRYSKGRVGRP